MGKLGRVGSPDSLKAQLVTEICSISSRSIANAGHCRVHCSRKPHFIDWYLLLRVEENAEIDVIRKQYRKLVLQLHPDKNKHPKAEIAFKLVSEAYAILSDETKRRDFDSVRANSFCQECNKISYKTSAGFAAKQGRADTCLKQLRQVREKLKEEVRIIEKCLKIKRESNREFPVFDPSDQLFGDYPHIRRNQVFKKSEDLRHLQSRGFQCVDKRRGNSESPIFEIRPERALHQQKRMYVGTY